MEKINLKAEGKLIEFFIALLFIGIGIIFRLMPHAPNFTPIAAIALFGGIYLSKRTAFILPVLALMISDIFIGFYEPKLMIAVYGSFLLCVILGLYLKAHKKWYTVLGGSVAGSVSFFLVTNFAVWAFTPWYAKTFSGIIQCYLMALPFFKNTLMGDLFYIILFFGIYEGVELWIKKKYGYPVYKPSLV
jgi:hypothetical protein